jgi:hypothetical protein
MIPEGDKITQQRQLAGYKGRVCPEVTGSLNLLMEMVVIESYP